MRRPRSSVSGGRDLSCSAATIRISSRTIDLMDMLVNAPDRQRDITKTDAGKSSIIYVIISQMRRSNGRSCVDDVGRANRRATRGRQTEAAKHCQNREKLFKIFSSQYIRPYCAPNLAYLLAIVLAVAAAIFFHVKLKIYTTNVTRNKIFRNPT